MIDLLVGRMAVENKLEDDKRMNVVVDCLLLGTIVLVGILW